MYNKLIDKLNVDSSSSNSQADKQTKTTKSNITIRELIMDLAYLKNQCHTRYDS